MAGGVASSQVSRDMCVREERPRGSTGVPSGLSWVQMAIDAPWMRSTSGVRSGGGKTEREMELGTVL